jgi:hypothetical protein
MECEQAQPACAVSHDATDGSAAAAQQVEDGDSGGRPPAIDQTDGSAAAAQQVEDGDSGGRPPAIDQVALAFMENMKVRSFLCSTADVFNVPIVLGKPANVSNMYSSLFEHWSLTSSSFDLAINHTSQQQFTTLLANSVEARFQRGRHSRSSRIPSAVTMTLGMIFSLSSTTETHGGDLEISTHISSQFRNSSSPHISHRCACRRCRCHGSPVVAPIRLLTRLYTVLITHTQDLSIRMDKIRRTRSAVMNSNHTQSLHFSPLMALRPRTSSLRPSL